MPWRETTDPYKIWLSEIILQQTQVVQGLSYYLKFIEKYPSVTVLAKAKEDEVLKLWQGLGYYSRARNLLFAAKQIVNEFDGSFPKNYEALLKLKGVGKYTAAAISSFAYNQANAVVDGNVYRFLSRYLNCSLPIDSVKGIAFFQNAANELLNPKQAGLHNQAIMEFGSQHCKPVQPLCNTCPFNTSCGANALGTVNNLPKKEKKITVKSRFFTYFVITDLNDNVYLLRREKNDVWKGLYEFYLVETPKAITEPVTLIKNDPYLLKKIGKNFKLIEQSKAYKHILSHQHLFVAFVVIKIKRKLPNNKVHKDEINKFALPRLIEKFITDSRFFNNM
ncbi:MAG: A/G-specific adenine glycosylase [Bacteroidetes bacterium]|nr:A/G-specific adenine glycosylase [Bacteroidota bacterium]